MPSDLSEAIDPSAGFLVMGDRPIATTSPELHATDIRRNVRAIRPHMDGGLNDLFRAGALDVCATNTEISTPSFDTTQGMQARLLNG